MFCSNCGANNEDQSKFCFQCGNRMENVNSVTQHQQAPIESDSNNQSHEFYTQASNQEPEYTPQQVSNQQQQTYSQPQAPYLQQPKYVQPQTPIYNQPTHGQNNVQSFTPTVKSKKTLFMSLSGLAVVAVIVTIVFLSPSKGGGVLDSILKAAKGTLESGSVEIEVETSDYYSGRSTDSGEGVVVFNPSKEEFGLDITFDGDRTIVYDGEMYSIYNKEVWYSEDVSRELDAFFEYYDEYKGAFKGLTAVDWKDAIKEAGLSRVIGAYVDVDELEKCMKKLEKNLNSKDFFEEVCDEFSVKKTSKGTKYTFEFDVPKLAESVLEIFEPAIKYDLDDVVDMIVEQVDVFEQLLIEVTIKDNKLVELHADVSIEDWYGNTERNEVMIEFSNYGKASLDEDEIEDAIRNTRSW